jgi:dTMP kinase
MSMGRFIALEGGEGVGKSTQARLLADALEMQGITAVLTREPGGTPGAEAIRKLLLDPPGQGWGLQAEALLFASARADHVERLIHPALAKGEWVVCDRFIDSTRAYQGGGGGLSDSDILALHRFGSGGLLPDLTLLLDLPPDVAGARLAARDGAGSDAIGGRDAAYHARVAAAFARIAEAEPGRFVRIDGQGSPEEIHARIMAALVPLLEHAA